MTNVVEAEADAFVPENLLLLYKQLREVTEVLQMHQQQITNNDILSTKKVVVHCLDGCRKSGLFVACCNLMLQMDAEELVHVPLCVMNVRETIADAVANENQLKLLFEIAKMHLDNQAYVNFDKRFDYPTQLPY